VRIENDVKNGTMIAAPVEQEQQPAADADSPAKDGSSINAQSTAKRSRQGSRSYNMFKGENKKMQEQTK